MINAVIIDEKDDVAVAIEPIKKGEEVSYKNKNGEVKTLKAISDVTIYHKIAIKAVLKGAKVTKYGEHIGEATSEINIGEHVHTHNVIGVREDLDI